MTRVLVLSEASVNLPHRRPYEALARRPGWEVHIACVERIPVGNGSFKECSPAPPGAAYRLHTVPWHLAGSQRLSWFGHLGELIRQVRPGVIFVEHDPGCVLVLQAAVLGRLYGARVVPFTPENIERNRWHDALRGLRRGDPKGVARDAVIAALNGAGRVASDGLAVMTREAQAIFERAWGQDKPMVIVPLGTDMELFRPMDVGELRAELGLNGKFVVGYFGRLVPEKGVDLIIEAVSALPARFHLLLDMFKNFAPGSYAADLMAQIDRHRMRDRVAVIDVAHDEVPRYMNCCDVVALPSRTVERWKEQFGRVLPEAMACEVAVVGSSSGNIPDMIGDAGLVVPEGSAEALSEAFKKLEADPDLRQTLGRKGRERVEEFLSVRRQTDMLVELFSRVLEREGQ
ncbi:MAG: hypothetical protein AMXMBFR56_69630 [Polyangiaceae bacterium]